MKINYKIRKQYQNIWKIGDRVQFKNEVHPIDKLLVSKEEKSKIYTIKEIWLYTTHDESIDKRYAVNIGLQSNFFWSSLINLDT